MLSALVFDVDGTLADTEAAHCAAFNHAFAEVGLDWHWDTALYTRLLEISGGRERIRHYWQQVQPGMTSIDASALADMLRRLHDIKTAAYEQAVQDVAVHLRPVAVRLHLLVARGRAAARRDGPPPTRGAVAARSRPNGPPERREKRAH